MSNSVSAQSDYSNDEPAQLTGIETSHLRYLEAAILQFPESIKSYLLLWSSYGIDFNIGPAGQIILSKNSIDSLDAKTHFKFMVDKGLFEHHFNMKLEIMEMVPRQSGTLKKNIQDYIVGIMNFGATK